MGNKKINIISFIMLTLVLLLISPSQAHAEYADIGPIKWLIDEFITAVKGHNVAVATSFTCGNTYRKDWLPGTYMRFTGKYYIWTDAYGDVHVHLFTMNPPMSLEGFRPPMTLNTSPYDMDGNVVIGDPGYWIRHRIYLTRPCVDFVLTLRQNTGMGAAWNYWMSQNNVSKYQSQWAAIGLESNGFVPSMHMTSDINSMENPDLGEVDWTYWDGLTYDIGDINMEEEQTFMEKYAPYAFNIILVLVCVALVVGAVILLRIPVPV